jgi:hypothetical protein
MPRPSLQGKLADVLAEVHSAPLTHALFVKGARPWKIDSPCQLQDTSIADFDEGALAREGFRYVLGVADVQDIVLNATEQKPSVSAADLVRAFNYYVDNDAFINFSP